MTTQVLPTTVDTEMGYITSIGVDSTSGSLNGSGGTDEDYGGATIASPIIMFMAGVLGNILALLVIRRTRLESQRLMFHSLVAALVWNDLLGIVLTSPVTIAAYINNKQMPGGEHLCRFNGLVMVCFGLSTPLIVGFMAVERFLFVKHTFFYTKHCVPGAARSIVFALWVFVLFFGLLPLLGFGEYVVQYPQTWCFLNFNTTEIVHAVYGYLYSCMILVLVLIMVACNLVVVLTLARVRQFRRKHSTTSLNSVLAGDTVLDETAKQQAMAKRRRQKDIELQMIVVVCAITAVFAICWAPLMIHILLSLIRGGKSAPLFGLVTIRLASLNQTLNPWLYVILRRTLIIRIKKMCCRWRKLMRKKTRPRQRQTPAVGGRRHQYVHVRNQLCHRNMFVGEEPDSLSLTDSMRKSLQRAMPGAVSLPDVMMLDTGRRGEQLPLPDIAKAQSFAGRVSHGTGRAMDDTDCYGGDSHTDCPYCCQAVYPIIPINFVSDSDCSECIREREMMAAKVEQLKQRLYNSVPAVRKFPTHIPDIETSRQNGSEDEVREYDENQSTFICGNHKADPKAVDLEDEEPPHSPIEQVTSNTNEAPSRHASLCHKHADEASRSSIKGDSRKDYKEPLSLSSKSSSVKRDLKSLKNSNSSSSRSSDVPPTKGHRKLTGGSPRNSTSLKSSSGSSSVKTKLPLQQSNSLEVPAIASRSTSPVDFNSRRVKSHAGSTYAPLENPSIISNDKDNDSDKSDSLDDDKVEILPSTLRTDTTTDDYGFSSMPSMPTESVLISEQAPNPKTVSKKPVKNSPSFRQKSFLGRFGGSGKSTPVKTQDIVSGLPPRAVRKSNKVVSSAKPAKGNSIELEEHHHKNNQSEKVQEHFNRSPPTDSERPAVRSPSLPSSEVSPTETRKESDATSGIFSDESPCLADRRDGRGKPLVQKESHSDVKPTSRFNDKEAVRKVKSIH